MAVNTELRSQINTVDNESTNLKEWLQDESHTFKDESLAEELAELLEEVNNKINELQESQTWI